MHLLNLQDYTIYIGDIWSAWKEFLNAKDYSQLAVLVDENTRKHCLPIFQERTQRLDIQIVEIPAGEQHKHLDTCASIWTQLMDAGIERNALLVNLGGGVIGDMGGFCARTFKRGIDFVQFPTTLLSQVDASIGGKLGIDFHQVKNSIGLFCNPKAVFIEPEFLKTLSERELRSGFAEIIKHSLIADAKQWQKLQDTHALSTLQWADYLLPSLRIKQRIVEEDPFEKGIRKALNFGHTIGHAVEGILLETNDPLLHGEAIAIGMVSEAYLSHKIAGLPLSDVEAVSQFLLRFYDARPLNTADYDSFLHLMTKDKKNENSQINFTLINPIGTAVINQTCSEALIVESLDYYNQVIEKVTV